MSYFFRTDAEFKRDYGYLFWRYQKRAERMRRENYKRWARFVVL